MSGPHEGPLPLAEPSALTLTSVVVPATVSRTKMSAARLLSSGTRLLAAVSKATNWPLEDSTAQPTSSLPPPMPLVLTLTRTLFVVARSRRYKSRCGSARRDKVKAAVVVEHRNGSRCLAQTFVGQLLNPAVEVQQVAGFSN